MKKEKVDYIFFTECIREDKKGERSGSVKFCGRNVAGIKILEVEVSEKRSRKKQERAGGENLPRLNKKIIKKIKRKLKYYDLKESVVGADEKMAEKLKLEETLFRARKQELLKNKEWIIRQGKEWIRKEEQERSSMLLVMDSKGWNHQEVRSIFFTAKDYYEDIYIFCKEDCIGIEQIVENLLEEWGVVLHVLEEGETVAVDFALFLLKNWNPEQWKLIPFHTAYMVVEVEDGDRVKRCREKLAGKEENADAGNRIYSGLVYERQKKQLPYQLGVNFAWQNLSLYEEFDISIIAIYRLKW